MRRLGRTAGLAGLGAGIATSVAAALGLGRWSSVLPSALTAAVTAGVVLLRVRRSGNGAVPPGLLRQVGRLQQQQTQQLIAAAQLARTDDRYPLPFTNWSVSPDAAAELARQLQARQPGAVLETGSGTSTLIAGRFFRDRGRGTVVALESDPRFAAETRAHAAAMGLGDHVQVLDAPLDDVTVGGRRRRWHRIDPAALDAHGPFDLLLVDGPPGREDAFVSVRHPALPLLERWLAPGALIMVDDTKRPGERAMVAAWERESPGWRSREVPAARGLHLLERADTAKAQGADPGAGSDAAGTATRSDAAASVAGGTNES